MAEYGLGEGNVIVPFNPYMAVVRVEILPKGSDSASGDEEEQQNSSSELQQTKERVIELSAIDDNYVVEFSTNVAGETADDDFEYDATISIIDPTGVIIDSIMSQLYEDAVVRYSYGYNNGRMSPVIEATLSGYGSTLTPQGERIDLTLVSTASKEQDSDKTKSNGTYSGNISNIVAQIAQEEGWYIGQIEPTKMLYREITTNISKQDRDEQHEEFMDDLNDRINNPEKWLEEQAKKRKEANKNSNSVDNLLNPESIFDK